MMRKLSNLLNTDTLRTAYFAHFQSLINYDIIFWGSSTTMCNAFLIQKRIIRIRPGLGPRSPCSGVFKKLEILTVPSLYIFAVIIFLQINQNRNHLYLPSVKFFSIQRVLSILL